MSKSKLLGLLIVATLFFGLVGLAQAQSKTLFWKRLDVDITVLLNSDIRVVETQEIAFTRGSFHFGYRSIPTERLEAITDVEVWEGDRQFRPRHGGEYTYETITTAAISSSSGISPTPATRPTPISSPTRSRGGCVSTRAAISSTGRPSSRTEISL